jgi:hypothetical protein
MAYTDSGRLAKMFFLSLRNLIAKSAITESPLGFLLISAWIKPFSVISNSFSKGAVRFAL